MSWFATGWSDDGAGEYPGGRIVVDSAGEVLRAQRQGRMNSVFVWPAEGANPPSAFPFPHCAATAAFWRVLGSPADVSPCPCEAAKQGGFRAGFAGEKIIEKNFAAYKIFSVNGQFFPPVPSYVL